MDLLLERLWGELGGAASLVANLRFSGPQDLLPSCFPVTDFAAATIGLATLAISEWEGLARERAPLPVSIDRRHAAVAFRSERYLTRLDGEWPSLWDPIAGDYATRDGFIRLHTNYAHHRAAAERVLGLGESREQIASLLERESASEVEVAIVDEGGCAAMMRSESEWRTHPQGRVVSSGATIARTLRGGLAGTSWGSIDAVGKETEAGRCRLPLAGIRVLDLTRVIAGPTCTRVLAAWGASVLRIDPLDFEEPAALLADTTVGKRCASLELAPRRASAGGRGRFESLLSEADVLVLGYRSDALARLGYDEAALHARNPGLVVAALDAYGFEGPWKTRRGFDSLVQMSCGIADHGQKIFGTSVPKPLPAQALDHGSGYLLAAAVCRGISDRLMLGEASTFRLSLAATGAALSSMGLIGDPSCPESSPEDVRTHLVEGEGAFGRLLRVACPGQIGETRPRWPREAVPLGSDRASFAGNFAD